MSKLNWFKKVYFFFLLKRFLKDRVKINYSLKKLTSFRIGGRASILVLPKNFEDIFKTITFINKHNLPFFVLGNGTNLLASSKGYKGVIIKLGNNFSNIYKMGNRLRVESGASLNSVIAFAKDNCLKGMEEGFGIPGTVGGAVIMNASSFNYVTSNVVDSVLAIVNGKVRHFTNLECEFGYRSSIFQSLSNPLILLVEFKLERGDKAEIQKKMLQVIHLRKAKQPIPSFNAGSVFKQIKGVNVSELIDREKFKGYKVGDACVSTKHANFIVNNKKATSKDVSKIIYDIKTHILNKHNIKLETEIKYLGEKDGFW